MNLTYKERQRRKKISKAMKDHKLKNHWKGGKINASGYIKIMAYHHPFRDRDNYVFEHRLVMEEAIGRFLTKGEIVHHINGIKTDNRIENLRLFTQSEHAKYHGFFKQWNQRNRK